MMKKLPYALCALLLCLVVGCADDDETPLDSGISQPGAGEPEATLGATLTCPWDQSDPTLHTFIVAGQSGMVAQYGRGAGMISDVASHWVDEFARCLHSKLSEQGPSSQETAQPATSEPMPVLGLGLKVLWNALLRSVGRIFGRR